MTNEEQIIAELRSKVIHPRFVSGLPSKRGPIPDIREVQALAKKVARNLDYADSIAQTQ